LAGALLNAERGTPGFLLQVVDWPGGLKRVRWGRLLLVAGFFVLLAVNLAALTNALMMVVLGDAPPLLLLVFMLPVFALAPALRLLAVTHLPYPPQGSASPPTPPSRPAPQPFARAALAALAVFLLVTLTATVWTFLQPKSYVSTARIKVERELSGSWPTGQAAHDPDFIQTEFEVIQSQVVLNRVIQQLKLSEAWGRKYGVPGGFNDEDTLQLLRLCLSLRPVRSTLLIEIQVFRDQPDEAAQLANAIAEAYQGFRVEQKREGAARLKEQLDALDAKLRRLAGELLQLRKVRAITDAELAAVYPLVPNQPSGTEARVTDPEREAQLRPYFEKRRELDEQTRFRSILVPALLTESLDLTLPSAMPVQIVEFAFPAQHPIRPNVPLNIALGALVGFLAGLLAGGLVLAFPSRRVRNTLLVTAGLPLLVTLGLWLVASSSHRQPGYQPVPLDTARTLTNQGATLSAPANPRRSDGDKVTVLIGRTGALQLGNNSQTLTADALQTELRRLAAGNSNLWLELVVHTEAPFRVITRVEDMARELKIGSASLRSSSDFTFGPVIERVIPESARGVGKCLDLVTGVLLDLPGPAVTGTNLAAWLRLHGGDLLAVNAMLQGPDLAVSGRPPSDWDAMQPDQIEPCLRWTVGSQVRPATLYPYRDLPSTWAFRTAKGQLGLLQITGRTENPTELTIRYKLVQTSRGPKAPPR